MPYFALFGNFAWEFNALLISKGNNIIHNTWFALDCIILIIGFIFLKTKKERISFAVKLPLMLLLVFVSFELFEPLIPCFVIDILMALNFLFHRKKLSSQLKVSIAVTKLIGDAFAGIYYYEMSEIVAVIAVLVFICNITYLALCIKDWYINKKTVKYDRKAFKKYFG